MKKHVGFPAKFHTIRARILLITISALLLICLIVITAGYMVVSGSLRQNLIQTAETRLSYLSSSIDSNINGVLSFARACQISSKIRSFVMEEKTSDNTLKREAHDFITETYSANAALPSNLIRLVILSRTRQDIVQVVESPHSSTRRPRTRFFPFPILTGSTSRPAC
ncbi:MAG: hypothetical protein Q4C65_10895 [Eubacteriales bacterium]|nr:hypothetical protein [Eubacteriales bacterium]